MEGFRGTAVAANPRDSAGLQQVANVASGSYTFPQPARTYKPPVLAEMQGMEMAAEH